MCTMGTGMPIDYRVFLDLAPFAGASLIAVSLLLLGKRDRPGGGYLMSFALAALGYLASNTFELLAATTQWTLLWARVEHVWGDFMPLAWLLFVFTLTNRRRWTRFRFFWPLTIIPFADVVSTCTNRYHHLTWEHIRFTSMGHMLAMEPTHGPVYFVATAYAYLLLTGGLVLIVRDYFVGHSIYRRQMLWISAGILIPLSFDAIYAFHLIPGLVKDFTPLAFSIGAILFLAAIYESKFLVLSPLSRSRLFDVISDGIVVFDEVFRIVDLNEEAMRFLELDASCLGKPLPAESQTKGILDRLTPELDQFRSELHVGGGKRRDLEITVRRLTAKHDGRDGALLVLHDVTEQTRLTEELESLRGLLPICANCKKIRDEDGSWRSVEVYLTEHARVELTHGLCPDCIKQLYPRI